MLTTARRGSQIDTSLAAAFEIAKAHAAIDGAFPDTLIEHWFLAALQRCLDFVGWTVPAQKIRESVAIRRDGLIRLSHEPNGAVRFISNGHHLASLPTVRDRYVRVIPILCCACCLEAEYTTGFDACDFPPAFLQAVARLFAYIAENRGDVEMDSEVLGRCGAKSFLLAYADSVM